MQRSFVPTMTADESLRSERMSADISTGEEGTFWTDDLRTFPTDLDTVFDIYQAASALLAAAIKRGTKVRLIGVRATLLSMAWGKVSMVDLYVGFILFSGWIIYREKSLVRSVIWVFLMMTLGNLTASLYALIALLTCGGDWKRFWLGKNA